MRGGIATAVGAGPTEASRRHMYPASFEYHRPATVDEAVALLARAWRRCEAAGGRPQPDPGDEAAARAAEVRRRHRPHRRPRLHPRSGTAASRSARMTTHHAIEIVGAAARASCPLLPETAGAHRRRPGPQQGHDRRQPRCMPIPAGRLARGHPRARRGDRARRTARPADGSRR